MLQHPFLERVCMRACGNSEGNLRVLLSLSALCEAGSLCWSLLFSPGQLTCKLPGITVSTSPLAVEALRLQTHALRLYVRPGDSNSDAQACMESFLPTEPSSWLPHFCSSERCFKLIWVNSHRNREMTEICCAQDYTELSDMQINLSYISQRILMLPSLVREDTNQFIGKTVFKVNFQGTRVEIKPAVQLGEYANKIVLFF